MSKTFFLVENRLFDDNELGGHLAHIMTLGKLTARISLSRTKGKQYYDERLQDYYALFTQEEMCEDLHLSLRKIQDVYCELDKWGYIHRKKIGNHKADKIFITSHTQNLLPKNAKFAGSNQHDLPGSNSKRNISDRSQYKDHSSNSINAPSENENKESQSQDNITFPEQTEQNKHDSLIEFADAKKNAWNKRITSWIQGVHNKLGLNSSVLKAILRIAHKKIHRAKHIIDLIKNARTNVARINHLSNRDSLTRFEYNQNLGEPLAQKIPYIFNYANNKAKNQDERDRYVMKCLKNFCYDAFGLKRKKIVKPKMHEEAINDNGDDILISDAMSDKTTNNDYPRIPIFKIK